MALVTMRGLLNMVFDIIINNCFMLLIIGFILFFLWLSVSLAVTEHRIINGRHIKKREDTNAKRK